MKMPVPSPASDLSFGLIAWLEQTRVVLPLKLVECRFRVDGPFAHVEIDQVFRQSHDRPLDCRYTFPLPDAAAVHRCELHVNERIIRARVEELQKARAEFARAKADGHRAALVESERPNLFTLQLGNLQPGDLAIVRLAYVQTLERVAGELRLRLPLTPGVRYLPGKPLLRSNRGPGTADDTDQVPDASRLTPPRIDALHPDAAIFALRGEIVAADVAPDSLGSPTHPLSVERQAEHYVVECADRGATPDRDVIVRWDEREAERLESRLHLLPARGDQRQDFALLQLRPPAEMAAPEATGGATDFYFLLDRSGSMDGLKWTRACAALRGFVDRLAPQDRVQVTLFESTHQDFAEAPMPAATLRQDRNFRTLERLGVAGGTELVPAAEHLFAVSARHSRGRRCNFVILTDGQVGNEAQVLELFAGHPEVIVHTVGIDDAVNDSLLRRLARRHRGECWLVTPNEDITGVVSALGARLGRALLADLQLLGGDWQTVDPKMPLPDVYPGQTREILLTAPTGARPPRLRAAGGAEIQPVVTRTSNDALRLAWVRTRIEELEAVGDDAGALQLALAHNLLCRGAAFLAWDEAEKARVASEELYQPSLLMEEMEYERGIATGAGVMQVSYLAMPAPCVAPPPPPSPSPISAPGGARSAKKTGLIARFKKALRPAEPADDLHGAGIDFLLSSRPSSDELVDLLLAADADTRLAAWLSEAALPLDAARALVPPLLVWLQSGSSAETAERRARLRDWREALRTAANPLALCLDFVRVDLAGVAGALEARRELTQLRRNSPV
ncbi:MAG: VWA domain-containing protein [Verrucomicrobia bacterium]|nr:VWA domain-containing protein [Verrucomicrobiota bacterium]